MDIRKLAAVAVGAGLALGIGAFGVGAVGAPSAWAVDNIKTFGEQERLNGPNGLPYIGYTVLGLAPSADPVPHNGTLYAARLVVDGFGGGANPMIERFGARAESGAFYPSIWGASNSGTLYFDVVGEAPNSVVWNDGIRDILAWVPGETPLEPTIAPLAPPSVVPDGAMPVETDPAIVATPNDLARPPFQLNEAEVALPGFNQ